MATIGSNRRFNFKSKGPSFPSVAFLWPDLAAEQASEFAAAIAKEFAKLAGGSEPQQPSVEPEWTTRNEVTLELESVRLRDFSTRPDGVATLVCARLRFTVPRSRTLRLATVSSLFGTTSQLERSPAIRQLSDTTSQLPRSPALPRGCAGRSRGLGQRTDGKSRRAVA